MPRQVTIGIDPGAKGGVAVIETAPGGALRVLLAEPAPRDADALHRLGDRLAPLFERGEVKAYVEYVHAMPRQGVVSMFSFGRSYGLWEGFFGAWGIECEKVTPQTWQKMTAPMAGSTTKERSIRFASLAFPDVPLIPKGARKPSDGIADAICIAYYGAKIRKAEQMTGK